MGSNFSRHKELSSLLYDNLKGWDGGGREGVRKAQEGRGYMDTYS